MGEPSTCSMGVPHESVAALGVGPAAKEDATIEVSIARNASSKDLFMYSIMQLLKSPAGEFPRLRGTVLRLKKRQKPAGRTPALTGRSPRYEARRGASPGIPHRSH